MISTITIAGPYWLDIMDVYLGSLSGFRKQVVFPFHLDCREANGMVRLVPYVVHRRVHRLADGVHLRCLTMRASYPRTHPLLQAASAQLPEKDRTFSLAAFVWLPLCPTDTAVRSQWRRTARVVWCGRGWSVRLVPCSCASLFFQRIRGRAWAAGVGDDRGFKGVEAAPRRRLLSCLSLFSSLVPGRSPVPDESLVRTWTASRLSVCF